MPRYHDLKSSQNDPALLDRVVRYLASKEGFVSHPTLDPNGKQYNIGYGSKIDTTKPGWRTQTISQQEALARLKDDYLRHRSFAQDALADAGYTQPSGRVLDGLGLLFFNTNWNNLAESKHFKEAAKAAARGDEDKLITYAKGIDTINGRWNADIAGRRNAEADYMLGGKLPVKDEGSARPRLRPANYQPPAAATPAPGPTETAPPPALADSKDGPSIWDRIKGFAQDASDMALGTQYGVHRREEEALQRYRDGAKADAKPTPSNPIAAAQADEPGVSGTALEPSASELEAQQRALAMNVRDLVLDPQVMEEIKKQAQENQSDFGRELMRNIWAAQKPGVPMPENPDDAQKLLYTPADPETAGSVYPEMQAYLDKQKADIPSDIARRRLEMRRGMAVRGGGMQQPSNTLGGSSVQ